VGSIPITRSMREALIPKAFFIFVKTEKALPVGGAFSAILIAAILYWVPYVSTPEKY
jgi:hypothetical protein